MGLVVIPVAVSVAVPSSYQFSNWLVMPAAALLAVKLMPLAAVPWIKLPIEIVWSPVVGLVANNVVPLDGVDPVVSLTMCESLLSGPKDVFTPS